MDKLVIVKNGIWGQDTGCLEQDQLDCLYALLTKDDRRYAEAMVWLMIDGYGALVFGYIHEKPSGYNYEHNAETEKECLGWRLAEGYLGSLTRKFGVTFNPNKPNIPCPNESYRKWYNFWKNCFNKWPDSDVCRLYEALRNNNEVPKELVNKLPKCSWND